MPRLFLICDSGRLQAQRIPTETNLCAVHYNTPSVLSKRPSTSLSCEQTLIPIFDQGKPLLKLKIPFDLRHGI